MPGGPLPVIDQTGHNISPCLRKQLVLELKVWIVLAEFVTLLPSSLLLRKARPLNEDEPDATTELRLQHLCRLGKNATISEWRKRRRSRRWLATERLEQPNMEDVVDASAGWKLKTICHLPNALQDREGPGVARAELALRARVE